MVFQTKDNEDVLGKKSISLSMFGLMDNIDDYASDKEAFKRIASNITELSKSMDINKASSKALKKEWKNLSPQAQELGQSTAKSGGSFLTASKSLNKITVASRAATVAMGALKTVGTVLANMAMVAAVSALVMIPFQIAQATNEARIAAAEGAKALVEDANAIDNYKIKIGELQKALNSGNLTQGEAYNKRKELMSIQDELIGKYGTEKEVVDINNFLKKRFLSTIT